jgi:glycosyltransferase involved in cell wall biosynthesis
MKILFDAYWWAEGPFSNRTVQRELIGTWSQEHPEDELTMMVPSAHLSQARLDAPTGAALVGTPLRPHGLASAFAAPVIARRVGADLTITHNFAPIVGRSAVFIHDVLFQSDPEWFTWRERVYFAGMPLLAPRAQVVVTSSQSEAERIRQYNRSLRRVVPIGLAVRTQLRTAEPVRPSALPDVDGFLLTVGRLNVRKNLITTLTAALQSGELSRRQPLVVVGEQDGRALPLPPDLRAAITDGTIVLLARVGDSELAWLYRHARLFVFLSLDEGFGLTPVEALTFGCPCLVSDIKVFHETLRDRARYVAPLDAGAAAAAITASLEAPERSHPAETLSWSQSVSRLRAAAGLF